MNGGCLLLIFAVAFAIFMVVTWPLWAAVAAVIAGVFTALF